MAPRVVILGGYAQFLSIACLNAMAVTELLSICKVPGYKAHKKIFFFKAVNHPFVFTYKLYHWQARNTLLTQIFGGREM